ncbi:MAG: isochorismatase family protein [Candidatus Bathyarchaeota archaeon]|nr:isochorismatase family protein [Candidatus Bathyarchaeota archaeon]
MGITLFWDVDTQHDFLTPNGKLYVPGASDTLANLRKLTYNKLPDRVMAGSVDAHTPKDREFNDWPEHCVYGTPGQKKVSETTLPSQLFIPSRRLATKQMTEAIDSGAQLLFEKQHNDVRTNPNVKPFIKFIDPDLIVVYGLVTDICVNLAVNYLAATLGLKVAVVADAVTGIDASRAKECMSAWQKLGVKLRKTDELLNSLEIS